MTLIEAEIRSKSSQTHTSNQLDSFFNLMKPRVMSLVLFTCSVGLIIAPNNLNFYNSAMSLLAVALGAGAAGTLNMWYESDLDAIMSRTCLRPIPSGKVTKKTSFSFWVIFVNIFNWVTLFLRKLVCSFFIINHYQLLFFYLYCLVKKKNTTKHSYRWSGWGFASGDWLVYINWNNFT